MNSHLSIFINDKPVVLKDDFSIDIEDQNPIFNDMEMFSYPFNIPIDGNRWLVENIDDMHAAIRAVNLEHLPTRIHADGLPFRSGTLVMSDNEEISGGLSMNIDAGTQSFSDLISNLDCRDIPVKDQIIIGEKISDVQVHIESDPNVTVAYHVDGSKSKSSYDGTRVIQAEHVSIDKTIEPQALGFSYPATCNEYSGDANHMAGCAVQQGTRSYPNGNTLIIPQIASGGDYINTAAAYGEADNVGRAATYCNARICYKHYGLDEDGSTSSDGIAMKDCTWTNEDLYPYWVLEARRPQSGICFYVLYFLDCLFAHLGVSFDKSALLAIEDMKHLCFFTTVCAYDTIAKPGYGTYYTDTDAEVIQGLKKVGDVKSYYFMTQDHINAWLDSRGCGGKMAVTAAEDKSVQELTLTKSDGSTMFVKVGEATAEGGKVTGVTISADVKSFTVYGNVKYMVANSDNFPDESVSTVISALEAAFGIKFSYDYEQKKVTAYLLRDVLRRSGNEARAFKCDMHSVTPVTEKITGVRMRYSEESDVKDQQQNVKDYNKGRNTDYETDYDYIDYPRPDDTNRPTVYNLTYKQFFHNLSSGDRKCYIDRNTGNAYRVKVNGDATTTSDLKPVLFEVGQFKGVEYGDCSTENEDFIEDLTIDFQPVPFNDVNYFKEIEAVYGSSTGRDTTTGEKFGVTINEGQPILCAYVDEDMEHEFVLQIINETISCELCDFYLREELRLVESYDPSGTDDGNSPLQDDSRWGFSLAMMRGGGSDATQESYDYNYDGFGNSKWRTKSGEYALACDSLDMMGNLFDYNGVQPGIGNGERFSLKIRAYKEPDWLKDEKYKDVVLCNPDVKDNDGNVETKIRSRGLFDTFMLPYAYFLVNRKKMIIRCNTTVAQLADIPNHWMEWWNIGGVKCIINSVSSTINRTTGLGEVELTVYAL